MSFDADGLTILVGSLLKVLPQQLQELDQEIGEAEARWIELERGPLARDPSAARGAEEQLCRLRDAARALEALEQQALEVAMILSEL